MPFSFSTHPSQYRAWKDWLRLYRFAFACILIVFSTLFYLFTLPDLQKATVTAESPRAREPFAVSIPHNTLNLANARFFQYHVELNLGALSSTRLRIIADDCIDSITVNEHPIPADAFYQEGRCDKEHGIALDAASYLKPGINTLDVRIMDYGNSYGLDIYPLPAGAALFSVGMALLGLTLLALPHLSAYAQKRELKLWQWTHMHALHVGLALIIAILAYAARGYFLRDESFDYTAKYRVWYDFIRRNGLVEAYRYAFSYYTPFYTYLLGIASLFQSWGYAPLHLIKSISFIGEALAAFLLYDYFCRLMPQHGRTYALFAALCFLVLPTVMINGASVGQCDVYHTAFIIGCLLALSKNRPYLAMTWFGLALSFKLLAIFIAPLLIILAVKKRIPWNAFLIPILIYLALILPAWIEGRELKDLLTIYVRQLFRDNQLTLSAPSIFALTPWMNAETGIFLGISWTFAATLVFIILTLRYWKQTDDASTLLLACICVTALPFLLPKMHDRYFYAADVLTFVLAVVNPRVWWIAAMVQLSSFMSYGPVIFVHQSWFPIPHENRLNLAALLNGAALAWLVNLWWQNLDLPSRRRQEATKPDISSSLLTQ